MADGVDVSEGITEDLLQYIRKYRKRIDELVFTDDIRKNYLVNAFMFPAVDNCLDPFGWGSIDTQALQSFCDDRLSLDAERVMRMVQPVIKRQKRDVQTK